MAKESIAKENAVVDALKRLKEEELELSARLKPVQEAIVALEKIVDKTVKKTKSSGSKDNGSDGSSDESLQESGSDS
jgi:hypothetical protein